MSNEIISEQISKLIDQMLRYVITEANNKNAKRLSSKALLAFLVRIAGSWRSITILMKSVSGVHDYNAIGIDCAGILRCMYDALLQAKYLLSGIVDSEELGDLYLDFGVIEKFDLMSSVIKQNDDLSKKVSDSSLREKGEPALVKLYEMVKHKYPRSTKRTKRKGTSDLSSLSR